MLENAKYIGAMKKYASQKTDENRAAALNEMMFQSAGWSLSANAKDDPVIAQHLQAVATDARTPHLTAQTLQDILERITGRATENQSSSQNPSSGRQTFEQLTAEDSGQSGSVDGFSALVIPTPDKDWAQKWENIPSDQPFHCTEKKSLRVGEEIAMLLTFINPKPDAAGNIDITYDLKTTRPNGKVTEQKNLKAAKCSFDGKNPKNVYLAEELTGFRGDPDDPVGVWTFEFKVRDNNRGVIVPLKVQLTLEK